MDRITALIPTPRQVELGGRAYPAWEARLSDLALLQEWLDAKWPDPIDELIPLLDIAPEGEREGLLWDAHAKAEAGPVAEGTPEARAMFATDEGIAFFLSVALRLPLGGADVTRIMAEATHKEYAKLQRIFFGVNPLGVITRMLIDVPSAPKGRTLTWGEAVDELSRERHWTYPEVYALSLGEFANARRHGKPEDHGTVEVSWAEVEAQRDKLCRRRYGKSSAEMFPEPEAEQAPDDGWVMPTPEATALSLREAGKPPPLAPDLQESEPEHT